MTRDLAFSVAIAGGALLTGLLVAGEGNAAARAIVVVPFLLVGPGLGWVRILRLGDPLTAGTLAVAVSLGLETVVATALLAAGRWTPGTALAIIIAITLLGLIVGLAQPPMRAAIPDTRDVTDADSE